MSFPDQLFLALEPVEPVERNSASGQENTGSRTGSRTGERSRFQNRSISRNRFFGAESHTSDRFQKSPLSGEEKLEPVTQGQAPLAGERVSASLSLPAVRGGRGQVPNVSGEIGNSAPEPVPEPGPKSARPYQTEALAAIEAQWAAGVERTLLVLPTGCGKTFTFAILVQRSVEVGERALVIAHRTELLDQAADELREFGLRPQIEQGPHRASLNALVVVASVQTLRGARLARFPRDHFGLVIVDECHHAITQGYRTILDHFTGAA